MFLLTSALTQTQLTIKSTIILCFQNPTIPAIVQVSWSHHPVHRICSATVRFHISPLDTPIV